MLTPEDIENAKLRRSLVGGYSASTVRELLRAVAWDYRIALHDRSRLEEEVGALREEIARRDRKGGERRSSLVSAERATRRERATRPVEPTGAEYLANQRLTSIEERTRPLRATLAALLRPLRPTVQGSQAAESTERGLMDDLGHAMHRTRAAGIEETQRALPESAARSDESVGDRPDSTPASHRGREVDG